MKKLILIALIGLFSIPFTCMADTSIQSIIERYSSLYGVSEATMTHIVLKESTMCTNMIGDNGNSIGCVQINLIYHPEITKKQALDPDFSINWLAKQLSLGHCSWWMTCPIKDV